MTIPINLTDSEIAFADSPEGRNYIARSRRDHDMSEAYRGANARPWTDADEARVIRTGATQQARSRVTGAALMADSARQMAVGEAVRETARLKRSEDLRTAYRGGR